MTHSLLQQSARAVLAVHAGPPRIAPYPQLALARLPRLQHHERLAGRQCRQPLRVKLGPSPHHDLLGHAVCVPHFAGPQLRQLLRLAPRIRLPSGSRPPFSSRARPATTPLAVRSRAPLCRASRRWSCRRPCPRSSCSLSAGCATPGAVGAKGRQRLRLLREALILQVELEAFHAALQVLSRQLLHILLRERAPPHITRRRVLLPCQSRRAAPTTVGARATFPATRSARARAAV